jgi:hypothetical protein
MYLTSGKNALSEGLYLTSGKIDFLGGVGGRGLRWRLKIADRFGNCGSIQHGTTYRQYSVLCFPILSVVGTKYGVA